MNARTWASGLVAAGLTLAMAGSAFAHTTHHAKSHHTHAKTSKKAHSHKSSSGASKWMKVIAKKKTVVLTVNAGYAGANSGEDFDGYANGQMTVKIPMGWTVDVSFLNTGALPHSVVFEPFKENINSQTPVPAFPKAETPNPVAGSAPGSKYHFSFKANKAGKYRFMCAFPGHAQLGMWDVMLVQKGLKAPSVSVKK